MRRGQVERSTCIRRSNLRSIGSTWIPSQSGRPVIRCTDYADCADREDCENYEVGVGRERRFGGRGEGAGLEGGRLGFCSRQTIFPEAINVETPALAAEYVYLLYATSPPCHDASRQHIRLRLINHHPCFLLLAWPVSQPCCLGLYTPKYVNPSSDVREGWWEMILL